MVDYNDIFAAYLEELRTVFGSVLRWWERQQVNAEQDPMALKRLHACWPVGPVSHPRIIAVYRKYYLIIAGINTKALDDAEQPEEVRQDIEEMWQLVDSEDESSLEIFSPDQVLIDQLEWADPTLHKYMTKFIFIPIGLDQTGNPS